ncbi:MAG: MotA/TolQ/ExbB proton channel family protein [Myxococcaceae bacterium]
MSPSELLHYLRLGGLTLILILLASVLTLGVAVERWMALWNVSAESRALSDVISRHLLRGDIPSARGAAERSPALLADLFRVAFERLEHTRAVTPALEAAVERERAQLGLRLKKNLWILGTIGATTPFVGLFGTVAGIMRSFRDLGLDVSAGGTGGSAAVMTGISEALVSTAAGILVAVLAVVLYNYFQSRIGRITIEVRLLAEEFVETLRERPTTPLSLQVEPGGPTATAEAN